MLTLQELKQIVDVPYPGMKIPTAKKLKEYGTVIAKKSMGCETEILAFQNGYALYQVSRFTTVYVSHTGELLNSDLFLWGISIQCGTGGLYFGRVF